MHLPHKEIIESIEEGDTLILDDGKLRMVVVDHGPDFITARVLIGGKLSKRKGVSLPDTHIAVFRHDRQGSRRI